MWVRVNLVPIKDTEYAVANLIGGREYRFRVSAENAVGMSDPSPPSEIVSISTDQEATEPHFLRELRDAIAVESQRVEFSVDIIGTPLPDITWYKDGFEVYDTRRFEFRVEGDRYTLVLKEAKLTDEGDIRVRATNRVGVASSQATLRVEAPPQVRLPPQYEQGLIFDTDELIRLRVPYTGRPQPQAAWTHNGKEIASDDRHTMDVSDKYITLKIAGACRTDKGMYTLKLSNSQGNETSSFFVTVTDRPDAPSLPTITDVSGTSVTLRWDPPLDDGGCRISNYIVEYFRVGWDVWLKAASSRITWTQLSDLIVGSEYRFRVKAENAYGVSEPGEESDKILFEEAKSPTGYENLGTNGGMFIPNCDQGSAPERGLVGTPVDIQELSAQSGMIIESVSLKSSQSQYEELLRLQLRRLETFYSDNDDSENDDTLIQEVSGEEDFSSSDTETCMSELMEDRFPFLSNRSGTLSLDQSTTSLLGPLSPYFIHPSRLLGSVSLWTELGIVSGGLTPAHYLGTIRGISSDSDHTGTMNSPSTESCCSGQNFVATTHVYHSWTTPSNSPLTHNLQAAAEEEVFADDERSPTNTELVNMDEAAMGHYLWTGRNESPVADHVEADTCTNMAVNQQMSLSTPTLRTPDDEVKISNQLVRIAAEDGSPSYQRGWGRGEAAMIDQAVSNGSDSGSDNCAIMDVYNEGVTASRVMRSFCNEAASANLAMRDVQNEGMPANQVMRGVYNEGMPANQVMRGVHNEGMPANQVMRGVHNEGMPANQVMRGVHNEGMPANQVMRGVFNEETAANQVMRDFYNEGTAANEDLAVGQVTGSVRNATPTYEKFMRSYEAAAANQGIKDFSCGEPSVPQVGRYISDEGDGRSEVSRVEDGRTPGSEGDIDSEINSVENEVTAAGGQWTTRGRIAIANQFRIICGGLASMTHLGNLSTKRRTSHNEDGSSDRSGRVEDDDSSCNYSTTTQNSKSSITSLDTESSERDLEDQYRQVVSDTPPANQKGFFSLGGSAVNILRGLRMEKSAGNQQDVRKQQLIPISEQNTSGEKKVDVNHRENMNRKGTAVSGATHDGNVVEIKPFNYYKSVISRHTAALNENKAHAAEIMEYGDTADSQGSVKNNTVIEAHRQSSSLQSEAAANTIQERGSRSVRRKEKPSRATTFERSSDPVFNIGPISSTSTQNSECGDSDHLTENSLSISNQDFDELSSWEPKINKEITTRIDLLEDLVYRCLENEDVTMNTLGVSDNEESASPSPLAVLSPVSCGARVDVRRGELKDLISDLGELVSSMNEKSRTLSAENVAKFFEKTASVVRDHSQSPAVHLTGDQADSSRHSSLHSSRTHSLSEVEWLIDDLNHSSNPENKGNIIKPYDQVHIQSSILNRITYLDDVMNRCLENEDVTLNTLGSPAVSPPPVPSAQPKEKRIDASKIELKDLIGNLGSMVDDLGQKFNAYFPE
ncbi:uncharacterized protein LOC121865339 [Homarus americanus]|nr:uncharacterized protein LOC121865339 [Homarus americanus]